MQSTREFYLAALLLGLVSIGGCGPQQNRAPAPQDKDAETRPANYQPIVEDTGSPAGTPPRLASAPAPAANQPNQQTAATARQILDQSIAVYRRASHYSDQGIVRLRYTRAGKSHVDEAPLSVAMVRESHLHLRAYAAEIVIARGRLRAIVEDPATANLDGQMLEITLDRVTFTPADVYAEPTLTQFATAGLGGPAPQLELLLAEEPLEGLFTGETRFQLEPQRTITDASVAGSPAHCDIVRVDTDGMIYRFWIDTQTRLIRRVELPPQGTGLETDESISNVQLSIELNSAQLGIPAEENWHLPDRLNQIPVSRFVLPPPPLVHPRLGEKLPPFQLDTTDSSVRVSDNGSDRELTALLWIANHPASQMAAADFQKIADQAQRDSNQTVRFLIVMAEPQADAGQSTTKLLRQWNVGLPFVDDLSAVGRDIFHVVEAPTLVVLGNQGVLQWYQPRVGPEMATGLPALLKDLQSGRPIGRELRAQYDADQATYRRLIEEANPIPKETLPQ